MINCPHEAWDFGALQCSDCGAVKGHVTDAEYAKLAAEAQALREEVERLLEDRARFPDKPDDIGRMIGAHIENLKHVAEASRRMCLKAMRERDVVEQDLETLRARVAVVPERKLLNAGVPGLNRNSGWNACLDEMARLHGKTVSEGLLRKWLELMEHGDYREGHCMCGSPVDSHGIGDGHTPIDAGEYYAGQVMEELRALLNQDKENGNG